MKKILNVVAALAVAAGLTLSAQPAAPAGTDGQFVPIASVTELPTPHRSSTDRVLPGGLYAPKGQPGLAGSKTTADRAALGGGGGSGVYRTFAVARKALTSPAADNGCSFYATIHSQFVSTADYHSITECSVHFGENVVEIGWRKTPDGALTLFSYWWKEVAGVRTPQCYNGCGFVSSSGTAGVPASCTPGQSLAGVVGQSKMFYIQHFGGVWWLAYDGNWCGYYPDTLFGGTAAKDRAQTVQIFDELAGRQYNGTGTGGDICSDMGAAKVPSVAGAQQITKMHIVGGTVANDTWALFTTADGGVTVNPAHYGIASFANAADGGNSARNVYAGGPGGC